MAKKRKKSPGGGAFGGAAKRGRMQVNNHRLSKADWSEVISEAQDKTLRLLESKEPDGFLVRYGPDLGWFFTQDEFPAIATVDENGAMAMHAGMPGQMPGI